VQSQPSNIIAPGYFDTALTRVNASDSTLDNFIKLSSLKRCGQGHEYEKAIVFFASELSSFINGHVLEVSGGLEKTPPI
jgi:NAD(P)-dependent dehydrogenase (short-subunit alcohol dehydrogenase family)